AANPIGSPATISHQPGGLRRSARWSGGPCMEMLTRHLPPLGDRLRRTAPRGLACSPCECGHSWPAGSLLAHLQVSLCLPPHGVKPGRRVAARVGGFPRLNDETRDREFPRHHSATTNRPPTALRDSRA